MRRYAPSIQSRRGAWPGDPAATFPQGKVGRPETMEIGMSDEEARAAMPRPVRTGWNPQPTWRSDPNVQVSSWRSYSQQADSPDRAVKPGQITEQGPFVEGVARLVGVILAVTAPFWIAPVVFTLMVFKAAQFVLGKEDDLF